MLGETVKAGGDRRSESKSHDVTLNDIGITKMQSSRWQSIASVPEAEFEGYIADAGTGRVPVVLWKPHRRPWGLTWAEGGVELTTTGDDGIRATLGRPNASGTSTGPFSGVDPANGETSRSSRQSFEERL